MTLLALAKRQTSSISLQFYDFTETDVPHIWYMKQGNFRTDWLEGASPLMTPRPRFDLITFGGCTLNVIAEILAEYGRTKHYWRHSVIADMGPDLDLGQVETYDEVANRTLDRYLKKYHLGKIRSSSADAYVFECASDYAFSYLRIGDSIIPDIRSDLFEEGWASLSFAHVPELENADKVDPDSGIYWDSWLNSFRLLYSNVLKDKIAAGARIFFIRRYLSPHDLTEHGVNCINNPSIFIRNANLRKIYEKLNELSGIDFVDPPAELLFTSADAPSGGPWEMHPEEEYYTYVATHILRRLSGDRAIADHFASVRMAHAAAARCAAQRRVVKLESDIDELRQLNSEWFDKSNVLVGEIEDLQRKIEELGRWVHMLHQQRDGLLEQNKELCEKLESASRDVGYLTRTCQDLKVKNDTKGFRLFLPFAQRRQ